MEKMDSPLSPNNPAMDSGENTTCSSESGSPNISTTDIISPPSLPVPPPFAITPAVQSKFSKAQYKKSKLNTIVPIPRQDSFEKPESNTSFQPLGIVDRFEQMALFCPSHNSPPDSPIFSMEGRGSLLFMYLQRVKLKLRVSRDRSSKSSKIDLASGDHDIQQEEIV